MLARTQCAKISSKEVCFSAVSCAPHEIHCKFVHDIDGACALQGKTSNDSQTQSAYLGQAVSSALVAQGAYH